MIDVLDTLRDYLVAQSTVTALTSTRIYAGLSYPPPGYTPGQYAICFVTRGGFLNYERRLISESFTFKCYGADELDAMLLYRTLVDALDEAHGTKIRYAELETTGYPLLEPESSWAFVLTYFRVIFDRE